MKDYYKILGVKETATAEEIHERWIELMHTYHPDRTAGGEFDEEMAKEINEAYEVLKHSFSRMEYDLERNRQRKMKRLSVYKATAAVSAVVVMILFMVLLFQKPQAPVKVSRKPKLPSPEIATPSEGPKREMVIPKEAPKLEKSVPIEKEEKALSQPVRHEKKMEPSVSVKPVEAPVPISRSPSGAKPAIPSGSAEVGRPRSVESQSPARATEPPKTLPSTTSASVSSASLRSEDSTPVSRPPLAIATEEEVRKFFTRYVDCYTKRDVEGFLLLFSVRAVQNQKDGWEAIRRIYENFFDQSEQLRYRAEEMKIEIDQNGVNVKARYEVDQILKKDGERKIWKGHIQWVLAKEEGVLKIVSLHYKHDRAPERPKEKTDGD